MGQEGIAAARDVARYFLALSTEDGDLITNLKMQKLIYYAYAHTLARHGQRLFGERIEAWPNGPVVPPLYGELKHYKAGPIGEQFLGYDPFGDEADQALYELEFAALAEKFPDDIRETLDMVYNTYMPMSAFELVNSTHNELPWVRARAGCNPRDYCSVSLRDDDIVAQFSDAALV